MVTEIAFLVIHKGILELQFLLESLIITKKNLKPKDLRAFPQAASPLLKPEQAQHPSNAHLLFEDLSDRHPSIDQFLASFVTDACHEGSWFANQTQLLELQHKDGILNKPH